MTVHEAKPGDVYVDAAGGTKMTGGELVNLVIGRVRMVKAPWTAEQVDALNKFQRLGQFHPFTCGNDHDGVRDLVATRAGWVCNHCDYKQDWAHASMTEPVVIEEERKDMTHAAQIARRICCAGEYDEPSASTVVIVKRTIAAHYDLLESPENVERLARAAYTATARKFASGDTWDAEDGQVKVEMCEFVRAILSKMREIGG